MDDKDGFEGYKKAAWDAAMQYLGMGWSILPLRFSDKKPAIPWMEFQTRQPTEDEVNSWFDDGVPDGSGNGGRTTAFGIGVITGALSGLVVCDCDNQEAVTYALNEAGLFSLLSVSTTRGQHLYFKHPGGKVQNKAGGQGRDWPDVPGLDLRGDGGYVVAPPSLKFDGEGKLRHTYTFNCPPEEVENFAATLPPWPGVRVKQTQAPEPDGEWSFDNLNLSSIKSFGADVWEQTAERIANLGRKMCDGDGRNAWLVRYVGECISSGMDEGSAREASSQYQQMFFSPELSTQESETVLHSVILSDKRNHPEKYAAQEKYDNKNDERKGRSAAIRLITPNRLGDLRAKSAGRKFLIDPFIAPASIIQVVGFNGHGKSLWLFNMLWAAARGQSFGSAYTTTPLRSLLLDFEGSVTTLSERIDAAEQMHGPMSDEFTIWNANAADDPMPLTEADSIERLEKIISDVNPQVLVIDTVRQAWSGMEENSPHAWVKVNKIALACRNAGMSVILVHHRNKPTMQGHGREAGSTAQLKDLDVQIIVTKVVIDQDQAKREAAMPDSVTSVRDSTGATTTAWRYLQRTLESTEILRMVFEISFGKMRQATDNHVTTYVGMAQDSGTGRWRTVSSLTPLQQAIALSRRGDSVLSISESIGVPQPTIKGWIDSSNSGK